MLLNCRFQYGKSLNLLFNASKLRLESAFFTQRFPFDSRNPFGYSLAVLLQLEILNFSLHYICTFFCLGFAGLLFEFSFVKDLKGDLNKFNKIAKRKKSQAHCTKHLTEFIRFYIDAKELSLSKFKAEIIVYSKTQFVNFLQITRLHWGSVFYNINCCLYGVYSSDLSVIANDPSGFDSSTVFIYFLNKNIQMFQIFSICFNLHC